jgi:hypothetical protein
MAYCAHRLIIFGVLSADSETKVVAVGAGAQQSRGLSEQAWSAKIDDLAELRCVFYDCLTLLADAPVELTLAAERRRGRWWLVQRVGAVVGSRSVGYAGHC